MNALSDLLNNLVQMHCSGGRRYVTFTMTDGYLSRDLTVRPRAASHACQSLSVCRRVKSPCLWRRRWRGHVFADCDEDEVELENIARLYNVHRDGRMDICYCRMMNDVSTFDVRRSRSIYH